MTVIPPHTRPPLNDVEFPAVEVTYPDSDGAPMAETDIHVTLIAMLLLMLRTFFRTRPDVYVAGNMFVYYQDGNPRRVVSPDLFIVYGVPTHYRRSWFTWKEGKGLDVVFEFTSESTAEADQFTKKGLYEWLGVKEYFLFDPLDEYLKPRLQGFRLVDGVYQPIPLVGGQLQSEVLGLTLNAEKEMLTLTVAQTGERLLPPGEEAVARRKAEAEVERLRAELERLKATKKD